MPRHTFRLITGTLLAAAVLAGCATLHEKQGQWIFSPSDRTWGNTAEMASDMQDAWVEFESQETGKSAKLHLLVHGDDPDKPVLLYLHGARWNVVGSAWRI